MAKTSDHQRNLQFKETDDETSSTSNQEQNKPPSDAATGSTTENASCKICGTKFAHGQTKQNHNRTKIHRVALEEFKKKKKEETGRDVVLFVITNYCLDENHVSITTTNLFWHVQNTNY
jgi:hypothetical protein